MELFVKPLTELAYQERIAVHVQLKEATVLINVELCEILLQNLVKNAVLYTTDGHVQVKGTIEKEFYILEVRNKGTIQEKDIDKIFTPFYRSDTANKYEKGTGLGLSIVKQICDMYHYEVKLYQDNGDVVVKVFLKLS
jgi:two-component system sensor histidine kinase VanS